MTLPFALIVKKEVRFVLLDGTAEGASKLVQIELLPGRGEKAARIQLGVAEEFE
jgi:hypothetical protein